MTATWLPTTGSCCLQDGDKGWHLWVVIYGPAQCQGYGPHSQIVTASITTLYADVPHDPACVLKAGDHPLIQHDSWVYYRRMRIDPVSVVHQHIASGLWKPHHTCPAPTLQRIIAGACTSRLASREFQKILGCI